MAYTVTIRKANVIFHAEAAIRKVLDVQRKTGTISGYLVEPDESVVIDNELLHRIIELRDADVNVVLQKYLSDFSTAEVDDLHNAESNFVYSVDMPDEWPSAMLRPLTTYIHNYLVNGILYDYLKDKMPDIAEAYRSDVDKMKENIESALGASQGMIKRPLQPF